MYRVSQYQAFQRSYFFLLFLLFPTFLKGFLLFPTFSKKLLLFLLFSSPELCSGWAIVIALRPASDVRPSLSVCPSVNNFKRHLWNHWTDFFQILPEALVGWGTIKLLKLCGLGLTLCPHTCFRNMTLVYNYRITYLASSLKLLVRKWSNLAWMIVWRTFCKNIKIVPVGQMCRSRELKIDQNGKIF